MKRSGQSQGLSETSAGKTGLCGSGAGPCLLPGTRSVLHHQKTSSSSVLLIPNYPFLLSSPLMETVGCGERGPTIRLFRKLLNEVQAASGDSRAANRWEQILRCLGSFAHLSLSPELLEADLGTQLGPLMPTQAQEK